MTDFEQRTYLITGVSGYLGSNMARTLSEQGHIVHGIVRLGSTLSAEVAQYVEKTFEYNGESYCNSLSDWYENPIPWREYDGVFHLAALYSTKQDPETEYDLIISNIKFTADLIAAVNERSPRTPIVGASTFSAYNRDNTIARNNLYSYTKLMAENLGFTFGTRTSWITMSDTYGPNDERGKIHNLLLDSKVKELHSPGTQLMVLNHIQDVVDAFIHVMGKMEVDTIASKTYTKYDLMYSENEISLDELIDVLGADAKCLGLKEEIEIPTGFHKIPDFTPRHNVRRDILNTLKGE